MWKLDVRLVPWLSLLYLLAFLDRLVTPRAREEWRLIYTRTNIGNAKLVGLTTDLHMTSPQYNATLTIFFVSYSVFEPLTNVLVKRLRPSLFIPSIMVAWVR